jgi:membrane protein
MHTSSYLEAFLSVYGWMMYNTLYELFAMTWLLFLPFMKLGFLTFIDTLSDSANRYGQFKKGIITFVLMLFALFLAVVPMDRITVQGTTIVHHCKVPNKLNDYQQWKIKDAPPQLKEFYGFDVSEGGKVPLLPSLVMRIASGTNNVIYQSMPCAPSVRDFAMVMKTAEVTNKDLRGEVERFNLECATPARDRINELRQRAPSTYKKIIEWGRGDLSDKKMANLNNETKEVTYPGSKTFKVIMSGNLSEISGLIDPAEKQAVEEIMLGATPGENPLRSQSAIPGVEPDDQDASQQQQANNTGLVKCTDWWDKKLYPALEKNASHDVALKVANDDYFQAECIKGPRTILASFTNPNGEDFEGPLGYDRENCESAINKASGNKDFKDQVVYHMISNMPGNNTSLALNAEDKDTAQTIGVLGVIGAVLGSFVGLGGNVLSSIADNAASFYAQMFFYRMILQMLQPMLLMGIFAFWGIYLIIADYRWETILKGLILIFIISILPGLWSISQHLDSALWQALYPGVDSLAALADKSKDSYVERILLDAASTVFNVIFPLILMYLVNEAGGGRPSGAIEAGDAQAKNIGNVGGRMAGNTAGAGVNTAGRAAGKGIESWRNWRNARRDKGNLPPGGSRY